MTYLQSFISLTNDQWLTGEKVQDRVFSRSYCMQYDRLLPRKCRLSVCPSVCDVVHCG